MTPRLSRLNPLSVIRDETGVAAIEFAFILPIMLLMALPVYDYTQLILIRQKLNKTTASVADMVVISKPAEGDSRATTTTTSTDVANDPFILSESRLQTMMKTSTNLLIPYPFDPAHDAEITVTAIYKPASVPPAAPVAETRWTATWDGSGTPTVTNSPPGTAAPSTLPASFASSMYENEAAIIVHAQYHVTPALSSYAGFDIPGLGEQTIEATSIYPCRFGPLLFVY